MSYQQDAGIACNRVCCSLTLLPIAGVLLVIAGCAITGTRSIQREIEHKAEVRAQLDRAMLPALPESALRVWWTANGAEVQATAAALLTAYLAAKRTQGKGGDNERTANG